MDGNSSETHEWLNTKMEKRHTHHVRKIERMFQLCKSGWTGHGSVAQLHTLAVDLAFLAVRNDKQGYHGFTYSGAALCDPDGPASEGGGPCMMCCK